MGCQRNSSTGTLFAQWYSYDPTTDVASITLRNCAPSSSITGQTSRLILVIGIQ